VNGDETALQPGHPVDRAGSRATQVAALYGGLDRGHRLGTVEGQNSAPAWLDAHGVMQVGSAPLHTAGRCEHRPA
jgi:hypothetical protein